MINMERNKKQEVEKMKGLIERAFEVCNNLRLCIAVKRVYGCRLCPYYENGCRYTPMLDVIEKMIEEVGKWRQIKCGILQNITGRSDQILKEKTANKNCPYCRYDNIVAFVMKHTTSNRPVEEYIPVNFCPKCGANLTLTEYLNDRLTY